MSDIGLFVPSEAYEETDGNYGAGMTLRFPRAKFLRWDQASRRAANGEEEQEADARDSRPTDRLRDEDVVWDMWSAVSSYCLEASWAHLMQVDR